MTRIAWVTSADERRARDRAVRAAEAMSPGSGSAVRSHRAGPIAVAAVAPGASVFDGDDRRPFVLLSGNVHDLDVLADEVGASPRASPAEVVATAFSRHGASWFARVNGELAAFVLESDGTQHVVRDRFGSHLLFVAGTGDERAVTSEIKGLFAAEVAEPRPRMARVAQYLFESYRYAYSDSLTFFEDVELLAPNAIHSFRDGTRDVDELWHFVDDERPEISDAEAVATFRDLLERSFQRRYDPAPGPRAFLLSGGLDSPTVAATAAARGEEVVAYSICFDPAEMPDQELRYDERPEIELIVAQLGCEWRPVLPSGRDFEAVLADMVLRHDEPIASPTWYSHWQLLAALRADGFETIFGGDGGDHILAGLYDDVPYYFADLDARGEEARLAHELDRWQALHDHPVFRKDRATWERYRETCFDWSRPGRILDYTWDESRLRGLGGYEQLAPAWADSVLGARPLFPPVSERYLISKLAQDLNHLSSPPSSRAEDISFATFGLDLRSILLDPEIVEFCWQLPGHLMVRDGYMKFLMRESMIGMLPEPVRTRASHVGLNSPANVWFRGELRSLVETTVEDPVWEELDLVSRDELRSILARHLAGEEDHMMFLWKLVSLREWFRRWSIA